VGRWQTDSHQSLVGSKDEILPSAAVPETKGPRTTATAWAVIQGIEAAQMIRGTRTGDVSRA